MNCPKCGTINNENAKICGGCGNDLSIIQTNIQPEQTIEQLEEVNQNTIQEENNIIIPEPPIPPSGSEYNQQQKNFLNKYSANNIKKLMIIIAIAAIIIGIVVIIVFLPTKEKSEKQKLNTTFDEDKLIRITLIK